MNKSDAIAIYRSGEDATVQILLEMSAVIEQLDMPMPANTDHPSTPSGMKPVYTKPPKRRRHKKPGRKKGHPGSRRKLPDVIHHTRHHTCTHCPNCQKKLPPSTETRERFTEELPSVGPEVTRHIIDRYWCADCDKIVEPRVEDALPGATLGLKTLIYTAWLHYGLGMTLDKIVQLLNISAKFSLTASGLFQAWRNLALLLMPVYAQIGALAKGSAVLHADETGWRVDGVTHWLWCFTNKNLVYFVIDRSRGSPVVQKVLGILFEGTLITDFYAAYNKIVALSRQKCLAHLFRELIRVDLIHSSVEWKYFRKKLCRFLKDALRLDEKESKLSKKKFEYRKKQLHKRLNELATATYSDKHARRLGKRLKKYQNDILTFLGNPDVDPDNNHGERQIRPAVIIRKNIYGNRSKQGAEIQAVMMSIFRTLHLRKLNPVETLLAIVQLAIRTGAKTLLPTP